MLLFGSVFFILPGSLSAMVICLIVVTPNVGDQKVRLKIADELLNKCGDMTNKARLFAHKGT